MKLIETYIIIKRKRFNNGLVDKTRYAVGAKSEKEAINILRAKIELGEFKYEFNSDGTHKYRII